MRLVDGRGCGGRSPACVAVSGGAGPASTDRGRRLLATAFTVLGARAASRPPRSTAPSWPPRRPGRGRSPTLRRRRRPQAAESDFALARRSSAAGSRRDVRARPAAIYIEVCRTGGPTLARRVHARRSRLRGSTSSPLPLHERAAVASATSDEGCATIRPRGKHRHPDRPAARNAHDSANGPGAARAQVGADWSTCRSVDDRAANDDGRASTRAGAVPCRSCARPGRAAHVARCGRRSSRGDRPAQSRRLIALGYVAPTDSCGCGHRESARSGGRAPAQSTARRARIGVASVRPRPTRTRWAMAAAGSRPSRGPAEAA